MKKFFSAFAAPLVVMGLTVGGAFAADGKTVPAEPEHFPIFKPMQQDWSFSGPFGTYDKGQLQRGLKVYKEVCSACHSMDYVAFRNLADLGYNEDEVKAFAAEYEVEDGPNADGEMFTRKAVATDYFPSPYPNAAAAAAVNNGAAPPDLSLMAKARAAERGFPNFVFDIFTQYAEAGPDYIYSLLVGFKEKPPAGMQISEGTYYNPYFLSAKALAMANPLSDGQVTYDDGAPETVDQYAHDVAAFLMWTAEPHLETRKQTGFTVMIFLALFAGLLYIAKRQIWSNVKH